MQYDYLICGLRVRFVIPWSLKVTAESRPFLVETDGRPDFVMRFEPVDALSVPSKGGNWNVNAYYLTEEGIDRVWHCPVRSQPPYCCVVWHTPDCVTCYYVQGQEQNIVYTRNLLDLLGLERFLIHFKGLILHASLVKWDDEGILFCAPSGTGKSTQADLWEQHMGAQTLNGDRAGIRCDAGVWKAWGLPMAGTSGIYRNESVPIRAVVLLRQGKENVISGISPMEAFKRMLPECNAQRWSAGFMDPLMGLLSALISTVPVCQLECRPDAGAVELLRDRILKED